MGNFSSRLQITAFVRFTEDCFLNIFWDGANIVLGLYCSQSEAISKVTPISLRFLAVKCVRVTLIACAELLLCVTIWLAVNSKTNHTDMLKIFKAVARMGLSFKYSLWLHFDSIGMEYSCLSKKTPDFLSSCGSTSCHYRIQGLLGLELGLFDMNVVLCKR